MLHKVKRSYFWHLLWLVPFTAFFLGYLLATYFFHRADLETPSVIGKSLPECASILSEQHLGLRLLAQREDAMLPEGTVVDQIPRPAQKIRPNQSVFVTISTKQKPHVMPDLWGKRTKEVLETLTKMGLHTTTVQVNTTYPKGLCIAQYPAAGQELTEKQVLLYVSQGSKALCIMPQCRGYLVKDIEDLLCRYDVRAEIIHSQQVPDGHTCDICKIVDQHPVAGSIVDLSKPLQVQLQVEP